MYLVLASKSPRRRELLTQAGFQFQINVSNVDETVEETNPVDKVLAIAKKKGLDIYNKYNDDEAVILSADTIVVINNDILGKPKDKEDARLMIKMLQNNVHHVYTAVFIKSKTDEEYFVEKTEVNVGAMTDEEIEEYINTKEPYDKAGGYGIQGIFSKYISSIIGDYYNVMGLPIYRVRKALEKYDFSKKRFCIVCKNEITTDEEFCPHCGNKIKSKYENQVCPTCHKVNSPNNKYCINCGRELLGKVVIVSNKNECMICHHINKEHAKYCESCGTILDAINDIEKPSKTLKKDYSQSALICGIVSLATGLYLITALLAIIPGVLAIILSSIGLKRGYRGKNILALIFGIIGLLTVIIAIFIFNLIE